MNDKFLELIRDVKLTKAEKILADFIINNFKEVRFMTSMEIAEAVNISHSTVIRFAKDIGYSGYKEFQDDVISEYDKYLKTHKELPNVPSEKLNLNLEKLSKDSVIDAVTDTVRNNIDYVIQNNSSDAYKRTAKTVVNAKHKYIVGYRGCQGIASFLHIILRDSLPGVFGLEGRTTNAFDFLSDIGPEDVLIAVTFPRYNKETMLAVQMAKEAGASVVVITDSVTAPITRYADQLLLASIDSITFFNSQVSAMLVAELLCTYVCKEIGKGNEDRLKKLDFYTSNMELF